ncbi:MAG: adenosine deaminase [Fidelibacterota bacterium]
MKNVELTREFIQKLPKAELHCHLDGSMRVQTIIDLAKEQNVKLPSMDAKKLKSHVSVIDNSITLPKYIKMFDITLSVLQKPEALERAAYELVEDVHKDGVIYIEVRYSPVLHTQKGMTEMQSVDAVLCGLRRGEKDFGVRSGVIICGIRSISPEVSYQLAELAVAYKNKGVVGYDLAGVEENFPAKHHKESFYLIRNNNINTTIHAGEDYGPESVHQAVHYCGANRIGHGVKLKQDGDLLNYVNDHRIPLEQCLSSNIQTGSVDKIENHPFKFYYDYGLRVTLNTDNTLVSNTTLTDEYMLAIKTFKLTMKDIKEIIINTFKSAFMSHRDRTIMIKDVACQLDEFVNEKYYE